jgi:hypothetical protein
MTSRVWVRNTQIKLNKFNSRWVSANLLVVGELVSVWVTGRIELKLFLMLNSVHHADIWRSEGIAPPILNIGIRCSWMVSFKLLWFHPKGNNIGSWLGLRLGDERNPAQPVIEPWLVERTPLFLRDFTSLSTDIKNMRFFRETSDNFRVLFRNTL